ncbi:MAG: FHA domain-containing protein [Planctomycetota bacterium]|nr:FHA domain-containing protein [Planctomycetota bacterium]
MQLKLKVVGGQRDGTEIPIPGPKFLIGRDADCNLRPRNDMISRHHCVLIVEQGYIGLRDFNSKNGTFVNGERICGERELKAGDELEFGNLRFKVDVDHSLGGPKKPKVKDISEAVARTASGSSGPENIDDWLVEDDTPQNDTLGDDPAESVTLSTEASSDTAEIRLQDESTLTQPGAVPDAGDASKPSFDPAAEKAKQQPKNTRDAAMDVLRKLRQQKMDKQQKK